MPKLFINRGGTWYTPKKFSVNRGGTWYTAKRMWINKGGTWQAITFLEPTGYSIYGNAVSASSCILTWASNGDAYDDMYSGSQPWLSDIGSGNGNDFHIRWSIDYGSSNATPTATNGYGTWAPMNSNQSLTLSDVSLGFNAYASGLYEVSGNGGSSVIVSGFWSLNVDNT